MRFSYILVCVVVLTACRSEATEPATEAPTSETQAVADPANGADVQPDPEPSSTAESQQRQLERAVPLPPDPNAPEDVAAPPSKAKRTDSGLAWVRLKKGKGKGRPKKLDLVTVNYTGWTPDGRQFDSSKRYPDGLTVRVNQLIPGVVEGLSLMVPGEKRRLWIPATMGYGEVSADVETAPSQPLGDLVFDVELLDLSRAPATPAPPKDLGAIPADAETNESGLAWRVLESGVGTGHPGQTSVVDMVYTIWTADGEVVDSTALRRGVDTVGISRLVPGWYEGMTLMVEGERRLFWIPEPLAYAGQPHRPKGMLVVDVKLVQIRRNLHQIQ